MDKSLGYWFEKFVGFTAGILTFYILYTNWYEGSALVSEKYYDILIKASSTVFGFLLAILALIINGAKDAVEEMRKHDSFKRLVSNHRIAVFLTFTVMILSICLFSLLETVDGKKHFISHYGQLVFQSIICLHTAIAVWSAVDTVIFVRLFYKIILSKSK